MTGQRKYWKSYAKSNLKGNWGIAIAAMLAVVAVNFIGNIFAVQLFPGDSVFALVLSEIFVFIVSLIGMIFSTGYSYMQLNICRGRDYSLSDLMYMFHNQPDRVLVAGLVVALIGQKFLIFSLAVHNISRKAAEEIKYNHKHTNKRKYRRRHRSYENPL